MKQNDLILNSQRLAYLLRHSKNIIRQFGGWVSISEIIKGPDLSLESIKEIVRMDEKGRFEIDETKNCIRALYGHSVKVEMEYSEVVPPSTLLHGTATYAVQQILSDGLSPRSRQFVHLTDDMEIALSTGSRHGNSSVLSIEAEKMRENGFKFYNPVPHVWLVYSVPAQYIYLLGDIFEEVNEDLLKQRPICIINLDPHRTNISKLGKIAEYSDFYHISQYNAKDWYNLTMVFVNEYDDWEKWQSWIEKIKTETPNFILFYTYDVQEELNIGVPYIKTTMHPEAILRTMDLILLGEKPLPISYRDFATLMLKDEKNGVFTSFNVFDVYKGNRLIDYFESLGIHARKSLVVYFSIPTKIDDISQYAACIQKSIATIPQNINLIWGCSYTDGRDLTVSIFEK